MATRFSSSNLINSFKKLIIYQDNHILVVFKPGRVLTQKDSSGDVALVDAASTFISEDKGKEGKSFMGIVHRIDRSASGVLVLAKTSKAASRLSKSFRDRTVKKMYVAVVSGSVLEPGVCENLLTVKNGGNTKVVSDFSNLKVDPHTVHAKLTFAPVLHISKYAHNPQTLLQIDLETGRKHQVLTILSQDSLYLILMHRQL